MRRTADPTAPATGTHVAPARDRTGMSWHHVGNSHVAGTADGCYEVRCVRDLRWEAVFVPASGPSPRLIEGRGTIFRSFDEALDAVEAFDHDRRRRGPVRRTGTGAGRGASRG